MVRRVELEAVSATALTGLIERDVTTAVVPFGSVEHHGGHLPPGSYSGEWLTSVMLAVRPELVNLRAASADLRSEVEAASAERGRVHAERFVAGCVGAVLALGS